MILIAVGFVGWNLRSNRLEERSIAAMTSGACRFDRTSDPGRVNEHVNSASFRINPPSGGVHDKSATAPGVFSQSATPPDGQVVHALEHGDIAIWYRQDAGPDVVEALQMLNDKRPDDVLVLLRPSLKEAVVATAWHKRLLCDQLETKSLTRFIDRYADKGPESPPETP